MFVRRKPNKSGTTSVQVIDKNLGYRVVKTIGSSRDPDILAQLVQQGKQWIKQLNQNQLKLFPLTTHEGQTIEAFLTQLTSSQIQTLGPELIFGALFDRLGFNTIPEELFRHLVIARLAFPASKLKTVDYLYRYQGVTVSVDTIYRFLDKLNHQYQEIVERLTFDYTRKVLGGRVSVVFYDLTTLYFEAETEDELRKIGFSKDGKFNQPQIMIGLLVGRKGYPLGYDVFEGSEFEGHTLIPTIQHFETKFGLKKPVIVADSGLLSKTNLQALVAAGYTYIVGARIKNESKVIKQEILNLTWVKRRYQVIPKPDASRLIINYSDKRAKNDRYNRERGLRHLEKNLHKGKLTKQHINNRGYNKYLQLTGSVNVAIDYQKYTSDAVWDGLKGYLTNSHLKAKTIVNHYNQLWQIEKAFRISKTDLRIRPIYHRIKGRIEAHICIAFVAYTIYKELERLLLNAHLSISPQRAAELTQTIYGIKYQETDTSVTKTVLLKMNKEQQLLYRLINQ